MSRRRGARAGRDSRFRITRGDATERERQGGDRRSRGFPSLLSPAGHSGFRPRFQHRAARSPLRLHAKTPVRPGTRSASPRVRASLSLARPCARVRRRVSLRARPRRSGAAPTTGRSAGISGPRARILSASGCSRCRSRSGGRSRPTSPARDDPEAMRAAIYGGPRSIDLAERPDPVIKEPTDAIVRVVLSCVCGSDLWYYRGDSPRLRPGRSATSSSAWSRMSARRSTGLPRVIS